MLSSSETHEPGGARPGPGWGAGLLVAALWPLLWGAPASAQGFFGEADEPEAVTPVVAMDPAWLMGDRAYRRHCAACHGATGRGDGPGARHLDPMPRDFTRGDFRWRRTASGGLPTDADLLRSIDEGAPGTSMPAWRRILPEQVRRALVVRVKTFSRRFEEEKAFAPVIPEVPPVPEEGKGDAQLGAQLYKKLECWKCHGETGRGDGPSAAAMKDSAGRAISPNELVRGVFRAGDKPEDLYRTLLTGFNGTPMPAYSQTITARERWALVWFLRSMRKGRRWTDYFFGPLEERSR